jgi:hypothetical protein
MRYSRKKTKSSFTKRNELIKLFASLLGEKNIVLEGKYVDLMPATFKEAQELNKLMILEDANVCGIVIKNEYAYQWFTRYVSNVQTDYTRIPKLNYDEHVQKRVRLSGEYMLKIIKLLTSLGVDIRMFVKTDYPVTFEVIHDDFEFDIILAPRTGDAQ